MKSVKLLLVTALFFVTSSVFSLSKSEETFICGPIRGDLYDYSYVLHYQAASDTNDEFVSIYKILSTKKAAPMFYFSNPSIYRSQEQFTTYVDKGRGGFVYIQIDLIKRKAQIDVELNHPLEKSLNSPGMLSNVHCQR